MAAIRIPTIRDDDWVAVRRAFQTITSSIGLGVDSIPTFAGLTLTGLTATRLVATDSSKALASTDLATWVAGTTNQITVTDDSDGTITLSTPQDIHTGASPTFNDLTISTPSSIYSLSHDSFADFVAAEHVSLPNTIANVLSDHNLAAHTDLGLFDASGDVDHDQTTNFVANEHIDWTDCASSLSTSGSVRCSGIVINDAGTIGSASDTDAMAIAADGTVNFTVFPTTPNAAPDADLEVANKKYVDDNLGVGGRRVSVYLSSNQAIASTTYTQIQFAKEDYDKLNEWDATNFNYTPSAAGYYHICSFVNISLTDGSDKCAVLALYLNGGTILAQNLSDRGSDATVANVFLAKTVSLLTTDTIDLRIYHYDGGNRNVLAGTNYTYVTIDRLND